MRSIIGGGGSIPGGIRYTNSTSGKIRYNRGGVGAPVRLRQYHTRCRVTAACRGCNPRMVGVRNGKAIHIQGFCNNIGGGGLAIMRHLGRGGIFAPRGADVPALIDTDALACKCGREL